MYVTVDRQTDTSPHAREQRRAWSTPRRHPSGSSTEPVGGDPVAGRVGRRPECEARAGRAVAVGVGRGSPGWICWWSYTYK
jgi:hypothetical protein